MTAFQLCASLAIVCWLALVAVRFRKSRPVLLGGLFAVSLLAGVAVMRGDITVKSLGLDLDRDGPMLTGLTLLWLGLMLAWSPVADRIATRWIATPPSLGAFKPLQQSRLMLVLGIVAAWILGGFVEELVFRGVFQQALQAELTPLLGPWVGAAAAILIAALGAGIIHLYQGPRAALIIVQLSALFGALFVLSGHSLWTVIVCHGLYDTIAFIRFATGKSRYARPSAET